MCKEASGKALLHSLVWDCHRDNGAGEAAGPQCRGGSRILPRSMSDSNARASPTLQGRCDNGEHNSAGRAADPHGGGATSP